MSSAGSAYDNKNLEEIMKLKRILFCFLAAAILILSPAVVLAEDGDTQEKTEEELAAEAELQEKAASYEAAIDTNGLEGWPQGPNV